MIRMGINQTISSQPQPILSSSPPVNWCGYNKQKTEATNSNSVTNFSANLRFYFLNLMKSIQIRSNRCVLMHSNEIRVTDLLRNLSTPYIMLKADLTTITNCKFVLPEENSEPLLIHFYKPNHENILIREKPPPTSKITSSPQLIASISFSIIPSHNTPSGNSGMLGAIHSPYSPAPLLL